MVVFVTVAFLIKIYFVPLSLSLCVFCLASPIRRFFFNTDCYCVISSTLTALLIPNNWYQSVGCSPSRCRPPFQLLEHNILFSVCVWRNREDRRRKTRLASHCVRSSLGGETLLCNIDTIVLHSVERHLNRSLNAARRPL